MQRIVPLLALLVFSNSLALAEEPGRPNIVLIMADDMGFSDVGCFGGEIETPHIDRLAAGGLRFTQFYNCAICGTTRASLLTGLYHHQVGIRNWTGTINNRGVMFPELLRQAGYQTMVVGKWDGGVPSREQGIERFFGYVPTGPGSYFKAVVTSPWYLDDQRYTLPEDDFFRTDALTDYAVQFIEEAAGRGEPFFLYSAYSAPHWPLHAQEADIAKYRDLYRTTGWDEVRRRRQERQVELGLVDADWEPQPRDTQVPPWEEVEHPDWQAERMAVYAAQVDRLDQNIGRTLAALDKAGVMDNTLILFLSDNGATERSEFNFDLNNYGGSGKPWRLDGAKVRTGNDPAVQPGVVGSFTSYGREWAHVSTTPLRGYKQSSYEGGISTPLVVHWPAAVDEKGAVTHQVGHVIDVAPTLLQVAGAEYSDELPGQDLLPLEGKSLLPIFHGKARAGHDALYWEFAGNRAVRQGRWKAVAPDARPWELYDLDADRPEATDLAKEHPERLRAMAALWRSWSKRVGAN